MTKVFSFRFLSTHCKSGFSVQILDSPQKNLHLFDLHCARVDPSAASLTQEMLDGWCAKRDSETPFSCHSRTLPARQFAAYALERGLTTAVPPEGTRPEIPAHIPHAFSGDELARFFESCDSIVPPKGNRQSMIRKVTCPAFFRLLYSSGIRPNEARLLKRGDVDLVHGVLDIQRSKGHDQHYVALHESMVTVLRDYDAAADRLQPGRVWFFQSCKGGHYSNLWVIKNFKRLWVSANGDQSRVVPYDLGHNYAVENILSWDCDPFEANERLLFLSKSMGHRSIQSTLYYFSIVPALADKMLSLTRESYDEVVPEVWDE